MRLLVPIFLFAAAAGCSSETPDPLPVEMTVTFFGQEPQRRLLSCGEQTAVELVTLRGHLTDQQQARITTRLDPATHICAIEVDPPLNPETSDIDWFLPSWAVETPSDFEKQMRFSVTAEKGADSMLFTRRIDWFDPQRQPMNELFLVGLIGFAVKPG
ncbi:MAG TPA: hypothetical protein VLE26_05000 [Alphaproteobacteria bacterium]|nr:hypothetical protein [Alphaproteobacteria bacterium]